ncbi:flagellar protein FlgN [Acidiferrimicrobium sp. IK]|uniref:flagellar protein FlgN n=1 Tax=Acidiferrimicrobium sp. IK TaxID=2871700 RepID=UPI0021CB70A1|nr:flagellar protein FlgN [Acidiferrimicrobium sp. IK]MCU4183720.1 flagellar protein FlgN [Acidiferrimicrobium sp. IK]
MAGIDIALQELSSLLWCERQVLDRLEFKLIAEQLVLRSGQVRWLSRASDEVAAVLDEIRSAELSRAVAFAALARELGVADLPPLRELIDRLNDPWPDIFRAHRRALAAQTAELGRLAEETRSLLALDSNLVAAALEDLDASMALDLDQQPAELALHLVAHQVATRGAMAVSVEVLQPSLAEFLA